MKALLLIVGILLILFGCVISFGTAIDFLEGTSEYSVANIVVLVLLGISLIVGGVFLYRRALSQRGGSRPTASKVANGEPKQE